MKMGKDLVINGTQWVLEKEYKFILFTILLKPAFKKQNLYFWSSVKLNNPS